MAFVAGTLLIDAPASALNNAGLAEARAENIVEVKAIRTRQGWWPYVSAQAFRYWLRTTLEGFEDCGWKASPVFREQKIAYPDANPIEWWDDDLFGYMRAPGKVAEQATDREARIGGAGMTPVAAEITRVAPFRVSTLVSIAPVSIATDFGTMSRHEGDPVLHQHQFYRTVLKGLFSLDLAAAGTFSYINRTGYRNLDEVRVARAKEKGLEENTEQKWFRLPTNERVQRVRTLLQGLARVCGGAKLTLHYTDVTPVAVFAAVIEGGNNPLQYGVVADEQGRPKVNSAALEESWRVWSDVLLSPLYVGWVQGFCDPERETLLTTLHRLQEASGVGEGGKPFRFEFGHPREVIDALCRDISASQHRVWME